LLVHPYDSALTEREWRDWIEAGGRFGVLAVGAGEGKAPILVPTHFSLRQGEILIHLHKNNSAVEHLQSGQAASLSVVGDYAFIPNGWRAKDQNNPTDGVPTSYYAAVVFELKPTVVADPEEIAEILQAHMDDFQPDGGYAEVAPEAVPYGPMMSIIRGVRLEILAVDAKFKYDDHKRVEFRERIAAQLEERDSHLDAGAAAQQRRRLGLIGEWSDFSRSQG
jgi:transcriptional regulator